MRGESALLFAQPGHVRVAEQRDTIRLQRQHFFDGLREARRALKWQAVNQIDIDAAESKRPRGRDQIARGFKRLDATHRFLNLGMKILNTEAESIKAEPAQRFEMRDGSDARIDFDSDFGVGRDRK